MANDLRLVLFDCDGTLIDSFSTIRTCMVDTFVDFKLPIPSDDAIKSVIGLSLPIAIAKVAKTLHINASDLSRFTKPFDEMTLVYKRHFNRLRDENRVHEPLYTGIGALLSKLSAMDHIILGMVTGKSRRGVNLVMEEHQFDFFAVSRCADECPSKPNPAMVLQSCEQTGIEPCATIVVGDAVYDMQMAKAAGAKAIGVAWGYNSVQQLKDAGSDAILQQADDLFKFL